jgi:hypothetical protein
MAEEVRFELTDGFPSLDFKSSALNRAQPLLHKNKTKHSNTTLSTKFSSTEALAKADALNRAQPLLRLIKIRKFAA